MKTYDNFEPFPAKWLYPDGSIKEQLLTTAEGDTDLPPEVLAANSDKYNRAEPIAAKFLKPDGTITSSISIDLQGGGITPGSVKTEDFAPDAKAPFAGKADAVADESVTVAKLAQEALARIDSDKITMLSGSGNDANHLTNSGVFINIGGYGLRNAPRNNYGWILIVSHGSSNGHPQGAQLYLDKDGFDFRGYNGSTFTEWETFIIKDKVQNVEPIADPSTATVEDVATAYNVLLDALKG